VASRAARVPVLVAVDAADGRLLGGMTYVPGPGGPYAEGTFGDAATIRMLAVDPRTGTWRGRALVEAAIAGPAPTGGLDRDLHAPVQRPRRRHRSLGFSGSRPRLGVRARRTAARLPAPAVSPRPTADVTPPDADRPTSEPARPVPSATVVLLRRRPRLRSSDPPAPDDGLRATHPSSRAAGSTSWMRTLPLCRTGHLQKTRRRRTWASASPRTAG
jgi:hypothetical protein